MGIQSTESNFQRQLDFAHLFICACQNNKFLANFVIGDKAFFFPGITQLVHAYWLYALRDNAPDFMLEKKNSSRQKDTVWSGMSGNGILLGSYFLW